MHLSLAIEEKRYKTSRRFGETNLVEYDLIRVVKSIESSEEPFTYSKGASCDVIVCCDIVVSKVGIDDSVDMMTKSLPIS